MKNTIFFTLLFYSILCFGCAKDPINGEVVSCLDDYLSHPDYELYDGQGLSCRFYYNRYLWDNKEYYSLNNDCADMSPVAFNCEGESITSSKFLNLLRTEAQHLGIIVILK